jgi:lysozyme
MNITDQGLSLIRRLEGFRAGAYKDAAGMWTIGYGHTSAAGSPQVRPGMKISRKEADHILARDVAMFAQGVQSLVSIPLTDGQFSALVSFSYNVGLENFRKSSVLRAVNGGKFAAVPRRLSLWVKSGGRVLPGLVNRRAAEAAMFIEATPPPLRTDRERAPADGICETVQPLPGTPMRRSSTSLAALVSAIAGVASSLAAGLGELTGAVSGPAFAGLAALIIVAAAVWIIKERRLKALEEGI